MSWERNAIAGGRRRRAAAATTIVVLLVALVPFCRAAEPMVLEVFSDHAVHFAPDAPGAG